MITRKVAEFVETWKDLFHKVLGVDYPTEHLLFEKKVKLEDSTRLSMLIFQKQKCWSSRKV